MNYLKNPRLYLIIIAMIFVLHALTFSWVCDDAFISFRYAKNFINGHGLVWNIGEQPPVEGYSNFLWIIVISLFMKVGFEPVTVSKALGIFFGFCCILVSYFFSEIIFHRKSFFNLIAPVMMASCMPFAFWSTGGLETQMLAFFILAAVTVYLYEIKHDNSTPRSAILFLLVSLTRADGILIFAITCLHYVFHLWITRKRLFTSRNLIWFLTFMIVYVLYFYGRFNYYGFIFPNTYYAKTGGGINQLLRGIRYLTTFMLSVKWSFLIVLDLVYLFKPFRSTIVYLLMLVLASTVYIVSVGGDSIGISRFFVPLVPLMAILVQEGIVNLNQWLIKRISNTAVKRAVVAFCSLTILILTMRVQPSLQGYKFAEHLQKVIDRKIAIGKWLHQHAAPNETIAVIAAGAIPYYSELKTYDRVGITDIQVAHTKMPRMGTGIPGHEKQNFFYILSKKPTYFFGDIRIFENTEDFSTNDERILRFIQDYEPFYINEPDLKVQLYKLKPNR